MRKILIVFLGLLSVSLHNCTPTTTQETECIKEPGFNETIVWLSEDSVTREEEIRKLRTGKDSLFPIATCPCMKNLQLWGAGSDIFGSPGNADDPPPVIGAGNDILPAFDASPNVRIYTPQWPKRLEALPEVTKVEKLSSPSYPKERILELPIVGVLDGGLLPQVNASRWANLDEITDALDNDNNGLKNDLRGWDFSTVHADSKGSPNYETDPKLHGSAVTAFIAKELEGAQVPYQIMPLKVLDKDLNGKLFNAACAMEYARQQMVKARTAKSCRTDVVNLSWGYYGAPSIILKKMIKRLEDYKIVVVAAAGNDEAKSDECDSGSNDDRNLDARTWKFYPASFTAERNLSNVFSVTTVSHPKNNRPRAKGKIMYWPAPTDISACGGQNYGKKYVDIGVLGDSLCHFFVPYPTNAPRYRCWLEGSSFATPIMTARVVQGTFTNNYYDKDYLYNWLFNTTLVSPPNVLPTKLKSKRITYRIYR